MRPSQGKLSSAKRRLDVGGRSAPRKRAGRERSSRPDRESEAGWQVDDEDELLTPARAATLARRSVRTIRRAYRAGALLAYRDGNGRGVRIRYGDLRRWMLAKSAAAPPLRERDDQPDRPHKRLDMEGRAASARDSDNLALLNSARARLRRGGALGDDGRRRAAGSAGARRA
jgi:hypothetical protein